MLRLSDGDWRAEIRPEFGMNVSSLQWQNTPILRAPRDTEALTNDPFLHGVPLLLPANRTKNGQFSFGNRIYTLPLNEPLRHNHIHGLMFDAPFAVTEQTDNTLRAVYQNRGERYPFAFDMTITDVLQEGWHRTVELHALEDMPYTMAFHITFVAPTKFSVPIGRRFVWDENFIPTGETAEAEPFGQAISGYYKAIGHTARFDDFSFTVSDNFDQWVLFNGGGNKGFLCIEPQCGGVNGLNTTEHRVLEAGQREIFTLEIRQNLLQS
ncbi:MAG: aldose 1-epimerase [Oscillospiraceae bacterium]|nr:aldose 1-epimerase [Oscillospiraceae bacterium]